MSHLQWVTVILSYWTCCQSYLTTAFCLCWWLVPRCRFQSPQSEFSPLRPWICEFYSQIKKPNFLWSCFIYWPVSEIAQHSSAVIHWSWLKLILILFLLLLLLSGLGCCLAAPWPVPTGCPLPREYTLHIIGKCSAHSNQMMLIILKEIKNLDFTSFAIC